MRCGRWTSRGGYDWAVEHGCIPSRSSTTIRALWWGSPPAPTSRPAPCGRGWRQHSVATACPRIYVDNGSPWGGGKPGQWTPLRLWLLKLGIVTIHARPYHPQGRGKNERFHRSLKAEVLDLAILPGFDDAQAAFDRWRHVYNRERPHQALGFATPAERYRPSARSFPDRLPIPQYDPGEIVRRVSTTKAYVSFRNRFWKVPDAFRGETLAIRPRLPDGCFVICFGAHEIASINLNAPEHHSTL